VRREGAEGDGMSVCVWTLDDDPDWGGNAWDTRCGQRFELTDGTPTMNGFRFCAYCGGRLEEAPPAQDECRDCGLSEAEHPVTEGDTLCKEFQ
jgi:hypothetical protein